MELKKIEIFEIIDNINLELFGEPTKISDASIGDNIVIIDDSVFVKHWSESVMDYARLNITPNFIRQNKSIFENID